MGNQKGKEATFSILDFVRRDAEAYGYLLYLDAQLQKELDRIERRMAVDDGRRGYGFGYLVGMRDALSGASKCLREKLDTLDIEKFNNKMEDK